MLKVVLNSAPRPDGMISFFFKEKGNFSYVYIYKALKFIRQRRTNLWCSILYKLISKVIGKRLEVNFMDIVDPAQLDFIPDRQILDNI